MSEVNTLKLPPRWTLTPVGDLLKFKNGLNKGKAYFGYGTPIVNYMDVFNHVGLRRSDVRGLVDVTNAEKQAFSARKGDVLFTRTSETPEEVGISSVLLEDIEDAVFSGFVLRGRPVSDRLTPEFAQYCFASRFVRSQIISSATYTTRALTNGRILSDVKLPLPDDPKEQQAIAAALSDADGVVAGLERVIAKKRLIKQGAMQDLLTARRRLPGFSGEWPIRTAASFAPFITSGSRGWAKYYAEAGDLFIRITNLDRESIYPDLSDRQHVALPESEREGLRTGLRSGDILISITADIGIIGYVDERIPLPAYVNQHVACLRLPSDHVCPKFVAYYLASAEPQKRFVEMTDVGAKTGINLATVSKLTFACPSIHEQKAIAAILSDMDVEIQTLESRLAKARAVKEGMLQNLLTARVRLV